MVDPKQGHSVVREDKADVGYSKDLKARHIRMIAIGGSIGTGLFLGAGGRLSQGGPALAIVYALCGVFAFIMVRALGEMAIRRPSSGAFVSYSREFMGEKGAYVTGWLFFLDWATTVMADITAVALYLHYWQAFTAVPQWVLALIALALVFVLNIFSVKFFGEFEFWFAMIKVAAIVTFMIVAIWVIVTNHADGAIDPGFGNWTEHGGFFPKGLAPLFTLALGVVFAFGGTEMVGVAAGEAKDAAKVLPKAVNSMIWRIALFYVGSVLLFTLVMPWTEYSSTESPFVTFFSNLGVPHAGDVIQVVVLTAALSSLNAGLYATGRTLRSMAVAGEAPRFAAPLNKNKVPANGIIVTSCLGLLGVALNLFIPERAFGVVLNLAGIGIAGTWISILVSHWIFVRKANQGIYQRPKYRLWGAPVVNGITIGFLLAIVIGTFFAEGDGLWILAGFVIFCVALVVYWFAIRDKIDGSLMESMLDTDSPAPSQAAPQGGDGD
jgi:L-asparagine permease